MCLQETTKPTILKRDAGHIESWNFLFRAETPQDWIITYCLKKLLESFEKRKALINMVHVNIWMNPHNRLVNNSCKVY